MFNLFVESLNSLKLTLKSITYTVKFVCHIVSKLYPIELFLIISWSLGCFNMLTKTMELNNLIQENLLNLN